MRRTLTTRFVLGFSVLVLLLCAGWASLVEHAVPTACSYPRPPENVQFLHCP